MYCLFVHTAFCSVRSILKWQIANGKWQIKCGMRNAKCEMKMPDAGKLCKMANWKWQVANFGTALAIEKLRTE